MELIVQPADGIKPMLETVAAAQKSIDIMIFRFDLKPMEKMLEAAVSRGVATRALIARESSQGDKRLRQLEMRCLGLLRLSSKDTLHTWRRRLLQCSQQGALHRIALALLLTQLKQ